MMIIVVRICLITLKGVSEVLNIFGFSKLTVRISFTNLCQTLSTVISNWIFPGEKTGRTEKD